MKRILLLSAILIATSVYAGDNCNKGTCTTEGGGSSEAAAGAVGVGIGVGVGLGGAGGSSVAYGGKGGEGGSVLGSGNSSVKNENSNVGLNLQGQQQGQQQANTSTNSNAASGYGGASYGQGSGNSTSVQVDAPLIPKPAANTAYAPDVPTVAKSCRLFIGGGGTSRDGSASGLIPIGNDGTCLAVTSSQIMIEVNRAFPGAFAQAEVKSVVCKIEGMEELPSCKK